MLAPEDFGEYRAAGLLVMTAVVVLLVALFALMRWMYRPRREKSKTKDVGDRIR